MEVKDITKTALFAVTDPKLITVDFAAIEANQKKVREARDKANPPKPEPLQVEFNRLRRDLYNLESRAKNSEIHTNNLAGNVRLLEQRINEARKEKEKAAASGNALAESNYSAAIVRLTSECVDVTNDFNRARKAGAQAANDLKNWPFHDRLKELIKQIEKEKP